MYYMRAAPEVVETYHKRKLNKSLELRARLQYYLKVEGWEQMGEVKVF